MLESINIKNYILIDQLDIDFQKGFSVMTGETGAGKSIILGAMSLLLGQRAETRSICKAQDKCVIEGHFDITGYGLEEYFSSNGLDYDQTDTILRREILPNGKSRAFVNDMPITLTQLRELGSMLIDIHSQHQNLALGTQSFQIDAVDRIAGNKHLLCTYIDAFKKYSSLSQSLLRLKKESAGSSADVEYIQYQLDALEKAHLSDGEQEELEQESELLQHAEEIKEKLYQTSNILNGDEGGVIQSLKQALQTIRSAMTKYSQLRELSDRLDSCIIELKDISAETEQTQESINFNPERLQHVSDRLDQIYTLQKKHNVSTIIDLINITEQLKCKLSHVDSYDVLIEQLTKECDAAMKEMKQAADHLTESRRECANNMEKSISSLLIPLGIPNVQFRIVIDPLDHYDLSGHDNLRFFFSANKAVPMQELSVVASGGEIARFMLCVKSLIADAGTLPTIIFDEIDTGVSGAIAEKMAIMMRNMSSNGRQVIAITHLPQIAALGKYHYKVYKQDTEDATRTLISRLGKEERIMELAKMMSGSKLTNQAIDNAKVLIENNGR